MKMLAKKIIYLSGMTNYGNNALIVNQYGIFTNNATFSNYKSRGAMFVDNGKFTGNVP